MIGGEYSVNRLVVVATVGTGHTWENRLIGEVQKNLAGELYGRYQLQISGELSQYELIRQFDRHTLDCSSYWLCGTETSQPW